MQRAVAASVGDLSEDLLNPSPTPTGAAQSFERVSDDEKAIEALPAGDPEESTARASKKRGAS